MTTSLVPALAAEETGGGGLLTVDGGLVFWTLVVFGLLFYVLKRYAWPELLAAVEAREKRLQQMLDEAEKNRAESAQLLEEHKRLLASARGEAQELIGRAKQVAEKEREALLARAREEQEELLARARREIGEEKQKALLDLRREAVDLALAAAAKLIEQKLDEEANRKLVTEYLATLERSR
ncbi:MAG: F0F1 ATP synthase subunit B [Gemmatimonadales bacterium]